MTKVIYTGFHNGYGFETLGVFVEHVGGLEVTFPEGDVTIIDNVEEWSDETDTKAEMEWRTIFIHGINDDGFALNLFEETDNDRLPRISAITEAAGLGAPFVLDFEEGTIKHRYR